MNFLIDRFTLKTRAPFNQSYVESEHKTLRLQGSQTSSPETSFVTPFDDDVWYNFAGWDSGWNYPIFTLSSDNKDLIYYLKQICLQRDSSLEVVNVVRGVRREICRQVDNVQ